MQTAKGPQTTLYPIHAGPAAPHKEGAETGRHTSDSSEKQSLRLILHFTVSVGGDTEASSLSLYETVLSWGRGLLSGRVSA